MFVMEQQSHRHQHVGSKSFLGISLQLRTLEMAVFSALMGGVSSSVFTLSPAVVKQYFCYNLSYNPTKATKATKASKAFKKNAAISFTTKLLFDRKMTPFGNIVTGTDSILDVFSSASKQDDLADALLQAVAFMEMSQMAKDL